MDFTPENLSFGQSEGGSGNNGRPSFYARLLNATKPPEMPAESAELSNLPEEFESEPTGGAPPMLVRAPAFTAYDLARYGWGALCIIAIFLACFAFFNARARALPVVSTIVRGSRIGINNMTAGVRLIENKMAVGAHVWNKRLSASGIHLSRWTNLLAGAGEIGQDFWLGAGAGGRLAANDLHFLGESVLSFFRTGATVAGSSVASSLREADESLSGTARQVSLRLAQGSSPETLAAAGEISDPLSLIHFWRVYILEPNLYSFISLAYREVISPVRAPFDRIWSGVAAVGKEWGEGIASSWGSFFARLGGGTEESNAELKAELKKEILAELATGGAATYKEGNVASMFSESGIVVMKASGSTTIDASNVKKLQDAFSDRVIVNFDESGQTGVVQPIFRDRVGQKYLFVLTPLNK